MLFLAEAVVFAKFALDRTATTSSADCHSATPVSPTGNQRLP
jgi:hypothetical protein